jgi:hypothetical protein
MSFLVLHMDKFKKESIRGIQSHNLRERRSHSNPDIVYERSSGNYELHEGASSDYAGAVQNRIDELLLTKAVRKDAVHMCGVIVSSDAEFFKDLSTEETRRFFEVSKEALTLFVGKENVISAMVHMDEKTPHMHFLHVPVTQDGRLNANAIYTRESLKFLQDEVPQYLQDRRFDIQRGVEQEPGSRKKHLSTREFKQQQKALDSLRKDVRAVDVRLNEKKQQESVLRERVQSYEQQAQEAEKVLELQHSIPDASVFNFKSVLEQARRIINMQKRTLAGKEIVERQNEWLRRDVRELTEKNERLEAAYAHEKKHGLDAVGKILAQHEKVRVDLEAAEKFMREPEIHRLHIDYLQREREWAARKATEQKAREREQQEQRQREERERQAKEQERQKVQELERRREEERRLEHAAYRARRGMGMGR